MSSVRLSVVWLYFLTFTFTSLACASIRFPFIELSSLIKNTNNILVIEISEQSSVAYNDDPENYCYEKYSAKITENLAGLYGEKTITFTTKLGLDKNARYLIFFDNEKFTQNIIPNVVSFYPYNNKEHRDYCVANSSDHQLSRNILKINMNDEVILDVEKNNIYADRSEFLVRNSGCISEGPNKKGEDICSSFIVYPYIKFDEIREYIDNFYK